MAVTEREPLAQVCSGGRVLLLVQIQGAEIVQTQCLAGDVAESPVLHERLKREAQCLTIVTRRFLDQRQVVQHGGGIVRVDARRRLLQRLRGASTPPPQRRRNRRRRRY